MPSFTTEHKREEPQDVPSRGRTPPLVVCGDTVKLGGQGVKKMEKRVARDKVISVTDPDMLPRQGWNLMPSPAAALNSAPSPGSARNTRASLTPK